MTYNPNEIALRNGNIFGFPYSEDEAEIVILPIAFDVTASYGKGAASGPEAILEASTQLDFYSHRKENAWQTKIYMSAVSEDVKVLNSELGKQSGEYFEFLENGGKLEDSPSYQFFVNEVNEAQNHLKEGLKERVLSLIKANKKVIVLGGEHSVPLGSILALAEVYTDFGVLQIDAHADLRDGYEGFEQSHASIMHHVLNIKEVKKLVQVGVRDLCEEEFDRIQEDDRIDCFFDQRISKSKFTGGNWDKISDEIIRKLPQNVYISIDVDGLKPELCPNTGTPVPGGIEYNELVFLLEKLKYSEKNIIGADLCEVSGVDKKSIDVNVGARILWELSLTL